MKKTMIKVKNTLMKKSHYLILAVIAMMTFAACTKLEDTAPPKKITFERATYRPQTKADSDPSSRKSILPEFQSFRCKAFLYATQGQDGYYDMQPIFGDYETIYPYTTGDVRLTSGNVEDWTVVYWAPSHDYYWPKSAKSYINFVAWYDSHNEDSNHINDNPTLTEKETVGGKVYTKLEWTDYVVGDADNLVYANEAWYYNNPSSVYRKDGESDDYKAVPMLFNHALAKLSINAKVANTAQTNQVGKQENESRKTTWVVTLSNVQLKGVYNQGTLILYNEDPNDANRTPDTKEWVWNLSGVSFPWTPTGEKTTYTILGKDTNNEFISTDPLTTDETETVVLDWKSVLPQDFTSNNNLVLSFDCYISTRFGTTGNASEEYAHEKIHVEKQLNTIDALKKWEMNKKITYTINVDPKTDLIKIDPAMVDWVGPTNGGSASL